MPSLLNKEVSNRILTSSEDHEKMICKSKLSMSACSYLDISSLYCSFQIETQGIFRDPSS